jgi:uncharacterized protein
VKELLKLSPDKLAKLMEINPKLTDQSIHWLSNWNENLSPKNSKPSVLMYNGEVFAGLKASTLKEKDLQYAQDHLRILSGIYGMLRPLDLMNPYRLEMGIALANPNGKNLYDFWGDKLNTEINRLISLQKEKTLVNLASNEFLKAIQPDRIKGRIVTPIFKEARG